MRPDYSSDDSESSRSQNLRLEQDGFLKFLDIKAPGKQAVRKPADNADPAMLDPRSWIEADKIELLAIRDLEFSTDLSGKSTVVIDRFEAPSSTEASSLSDAPKLQWL